MSRAVLSEAAMRDLDQIWQYYAVAASAEIAETQITRMVATMNRRLARFARSGRPRHELGPSVRSFIVAPYVVFYSAERDEARVLRILHGHRDIQPPLMSLLRAG